jgi:gamma-glutamyltranspeptidase/glutathione hydrolase
MTTQLNLVITIILATTMRTGLHLCWLLLYVSLGGCSSSTVTYTEQAPAYAAVYGDQRGAVASVNPLATRAGLNAFAAGGNALDAALAVTLTLGVVDPHNSGIGGGCFILVRLADGRILAIDGREMAPAGTAPSLYTKDGAAEPERSQVGALAVGIPGSVAALHHLHAQGGKLTWAAALLPAAQLAESGFPVDATMAERLLATREQLGRFPASAAVFLRKDGSPLVAGETLRQPDLAASYRSLAAQGPDWFYQGEFAERTADWMAANGGVVRAEDFHRYTLKLRQPLHTRFRDYDIYGFPAPSSGGTHVAQILGMLETRDLANLGEADYYHQLAETMRLAFADRAHWLGDPDFVSVPQGLLDPVYLAERARAIDPQRRMPRVERGLPLDADAGFERHTTHIAVADAAGNWVAITTTLNTSFGSKVVVPGTGVLLNNQMDDFALEAGIPNAFGLVGGQANSMAPGKRPLSSMSPTLVLRDGIPVLTLGAAGGPTIISQVTQVLLRHLALGQPLEQAMAGARIHHQWQPDLLHVEAGVTPEVRAELEKKGHTLKDLGSFGGTQAIGLRDGHFVPVTEPRVIQRNLAR